MRKFHKSIPTKTAMENVFLDRATLLEEGGFSEIKFYSLIVSILQFLLPIIFDCCSFPSDKGCLVWDDD
jgi:hypothetical protein